MFQRRRPPQLSVLEELQQTYADCCDLSIKNLTLEEQNEVEAALKGWKSLHTSLLFKLELFEKSAAKMGADESAIFNELRAIRDQNVKHLIRVQLRMDELNRRQHVRPPVLKVNSQSSNMSVPSLRSGGMRTGLAPKKKMLKSLRPEKSMPSMNKRSQQQASTAANAIWAKPKPAQYDDDLFHDFDQDQWEKLSDDDLGPNEQPNLGPSNLEPPNLIDLDDTYFQASHSMENLTLKPKSRHSSVSSSPTNTMKASPSNSLASAPRNGAYASAPTLKPLADPLGGRSASVPDVKPDKKYVYRQPQPMNISRLMKQSKKSPAKAPVKPQPKQSPVKAVRKTVPTPAPAPAPKAKKNITYNYVPLKKPQPKRVEQSPVSPTMDDIIGGYDVDDGDIASDGDDEAVGLGLEPDLLDEKVQDELIKSIRGIDAGSAKSILNDIVVHGDQVFWDDIVGLDSAKNSLKEAVVYPFLRPDLFQGLREPTRGMLLFGPPGTGKTMLARAVATESKSTFFSITSSSITSKYLGESEKLVRAMFLLAKKLSPSIVFIDEIDALLGARSDGENDSSRRIKNEFLVQWSELSSATTKETETTGLNQQVLILGATNMPWSIDEAARRRFVKRVYIPLPEDETRKAQIIRLLKYQNNTLNDDDFDELIRLTTDFSGSDITALCKDSAMGPLRSLGDKLLSTPTEQIRPINIDDFINSLKYIRPSVSRESLGQYEDWSIKFGSSGV